MKYCPECATAVEPEDKYCPVCGTKLARFRVGEAACEACGSLLVKIGKQIRCPRCDSYCIECGTLITKKNLKCPECKVSFKKFPKKRSLAKLPAEGHPLYKNPMFQERLVYGNEGCPFSCHNRQGREIDYRQVRHPVAERLCASQAIWTNMVRPPLGAGDMKQVVQAVGKVFDHAKELREFVPADDRSA